MKKTAWVRKKKPRVVPQATASQQDSGVKQWQSSKRPSVRSPTLTCYDQMPAVCNLPSWSTHGAQEGGAIRKKGESDDKL
jgi:hypothetical protein